MKRYADVFSSTPVAVADAPGRVNLLGEHTDYNDGFVLPTAIPQRTQITVGLAAGDSFTVYASDLDESASFRRGSPPTKHFASYVYGCVDLLLKQGVHIPALDIYVHSDVPIGLGLSSSAALEVATLRVLNQWLSIGLDAVTIAQLAQQAEIQYAKVNCGIMDQMASSLADAEHMLFIDTRSLATALLPLPPDCEVVVIDSGIARSLSESKYNERRSECEAAANMLGVIALRDIPDPALVESLPEPLNRRARHVVSENARVLLGLKTSQTEGFGQLMNASHASLRDDFEVSIPALDRLVELLQGQEAVYGARLTGAGFGGACVALCEPGQAQQVAETVLNRYDSSEARGRLLVPTARLSQ